MESLLFEVEKVPLEVVGVPTGYKVPTGTNHAIVRKQGSKISEIITFCSEDYGLTRNVEIKSVFDEVLRSHGFDFDFSYMNLASARFKMDWVIKDFREDISKKDMLAPKITVYNSYDRRLKYSFSTGVQRLVCANGLTIFEERTKKRSLHTTSIEGFSSALDCIPMLSDFLDEFQDKIEPFYDLQTMRVPNIEARLDQVISETGYPPSFREEALQRIYHEIHAYGYTATDWLIYAGLNYAIVHEPTLIGRKFEEIDMEVLSYLYA
jgi:hypothetical protein